MSASLLLQQQQQQQQLTAGQLQMHSLLTSSSSSQQQQQQGQQHDPATAAAILAERARILNVLDLTEKSFNELEVDLLTKLVRLKRERDRAINQLHDQLARLDGGAAAVAPAAPAPAPAGGQQQQVQPIITIAAAAPSAAAATGISDVQTVADSPVVFAQQQQQQENRPLTSNSQINVVIKPFAPSQQEQQHEQPIVESGVRPGEFVRPKKKRKIPLSKKVTQRLAATTGHSSKAAAQQQASQQKEEKKRNKEAREAYKQQQEASKQRRQEEERAIQQAQSQLLPRTIGLISTIADTVTPRSTITYPTNAALFAPPEQKAMPVDDSSVPFKLDLMASEEEYRAQLKVLRDREEKAARAEALKHRQQHDLRFQELMRMREEDANRQPWQRIQPSTYHFEPSMQMPTHFYKVCAVTGAKYMDVFDGRTDFGRGLSQHIAMDEELKGLEYYPDASYVPCFIYSTPEQARAEFFPAVSRLVNTPRALIKVVAVGRFRDYGNGKFAYEHVKAAEVIEWTPFNKLTEKDAQAEKQRRKAQRDARVSDNSNDLPFDLAESSAAVPLIKEMSNPFVPPLSNLPPPQVFGATFDVNSARSSKNVEPLRALPLQQPLPEAMFYPAVSSPRVTSKPVYEQSHLLGVRHSRPFRGSGGR